MNLAQARRFARQVALPELGPDGQTRILGAKILLVDAPSAALALETAVLYLACAGVSAFVVVAADMPGDEPAWLQTLKPALPPETRFEVLPLPESGLAWAAALLDVSVVLRADFGDDAMVTACRAQGVAAVIVRAQAGAENIDLLSLRPEKSAKTAQVDDVVPSAPQTTFADSPLQSSLQIVAGTLAATEALWLVTERPPQTETSDASAVNVMRHLQFSLASAGPRPTTYNIPWPSPA